MRAKSGSIQHRFHSFKENEIKTPQSIGTDKMWPSCIDSVQYASNLLIRLPEEGGRVAGRTARVEMQCTRRTSFTGLFSRLAASVQRVNIIKLTELQLERANEGGFITITRNQLLCHL